LGGGLFAAAAADEDIDEVGSVVEGLGAARVDVDEISDAGRIDGDVVVGGLGVGGIDLAGVGVDEIFVSIFLAFSSLSLTPAQPFVTRSSALMTSSISPRSRSVIGGITSPY